jgi:hypothetical protein
MSHKADAEDGFRDGVSDDHATLKSAPVVSHDHDPHHAPVAESKLPPYIQDLLEKVFKLKKRKTTFEVRF